MSKQTNVPAPIPWEEARDAVKAKYPDARYAETNTGTRTYSIIAKREDHNWRHISLGFGPDEPSAWLSTHSKLGEAEQSGVEIVCEEGELAVAQCPDCMEGTDDVAADLKSANCHKCNKAFKCSFPAVPAPSVLSEPSGKGIYVASRASIPERAKMWRDLRSSGVAITSTWIDEAGEGETADLSELWSRIAEEVKQSCALVLYARPEDMPLKGALIEVGMALAYGLPVFAVMPSMSFQYPSMRPVGSWLRHPLVTICDTVHGAIASAQKSQPLPIPAAEGSAASIYAEWSTYKTAIHATGVGGKDMADWLIERLVEARAAQSKPVAAEGSLPEEFTKLEDMLTGITPLPYVLGTWSRNVDKPQPNLWHTGYGAPICEFDRPGIMEQQQKDAEYIAAACNAVPVLLQALRAALAAQPTELVRGRKEGFSAGFQAQTALLPQIVEFVREWGRGSEPRKCDHKMEQHCEQYGCGSFIDLAEEIQDKFAPAHPTSIVSGDEPELDTNDGDRKNAEGMEGIWDSFAELAADYCCRTRQLRAAHSWAHEWHKVVVTTCILLGVPSMGSSEESLSAITAALVPRQSMRKTNRQAHEEASGMGLDGTFFLLNNIYPDAPDQETLSGLIEWINQPPHSADWRLIKEALIELRERRERPFTLLGEPEALRTLKAWLERKEETPAPVLSGEREAPMVEPTEEHWKKAVEELNARRQGIEPGYAFHISNAKGSVEVCLRAELLATRELLEAWDSKWKWAAETIAREEERRRVAESALASLAKPEGVETVWDGSGHFYMENLKGFKGWNPEPDLKTCGVIELSLVNPNVASYMREWEGRATKAETEIAKYMHCNCTPDNCVTSGINCSAQLAQTKEGE